MTYIEGYISKYAIRKMLDNYNDLSGDDRSVRERVSNSVKNKDGKTGEEINRIMLHQAIEKLPSIQKVVIENRYFHCHPVKHTCNVLNINEGQYYRFCRDAIEFIYGDLNGEIIGVLNLLKAIK